MNTSPQKLRNELDQLKQSGLYKTERVINSPQNAAIKVNDHKVLNLCANNYLGLADHPRVVAAAKQALDEYGFGMASVRFICGTQTLHKELETRLSDFLGFEDTILFPSCFDANAGVFEALLGPDDYVISDQLNHASIIDGIRLCKAQRKRYQHNNMDDLEAQLKDCSGDVTKLIVTDGVFSMDGTIANLPGICDLADKYGALVMIDDCHATGFLGNNGKGTHEHHDCMGRIDILSSTLGKALGGGAGGFICASHEIVEWLRQRARPYLFSNALAPVMVAGALEALNLVASEPSLQEQLRANTQYFRREIEKIGFTTLPGEHPIIPIMLGDAKLASTMADELLKEGVYVIGFSYPVVPEGKARIRTQMSAALTQEQLKQAIAACKKAGQAQNLF